MIGEVPEPSDFVNFWSERNLRSVQICLHSAPGVLWGVRAPLFASFNPYPLSGLFSWSVRLHHTARKPLPCFPVLNSAGLSLAGSSVAFDQKVTETPSEKLDAAPSRYHSWKCQVAPITITPPGGLGRAAGTS